MTGSLDRCRHCGVAIPLGVAIYADRNRKYCSPSCARAQLDVEQGSGHRDADAQARRRDDVLADGVDAARPHARHVGGREVPRG